MPNVLDFAVAQATFRARQIERALHDPGPWEMEYGGIKAPAVRLTFDNRVTFLAHFPAHCWLAPPEPAVLSLLCRGEVVNTRALDDHPGDGEWEAEWTLALEQPSLV